jgi:hypothetical protein
MSILQAAQTALAASATAQVASRRPRLVPLVQRMTFGANDEELGLYRSLGAAGYIDYHLHPELIADSAMDNILALPAYNLLTLSPDQFAGQNSANAVAQITRAMLIRAIYSKRQFLERLVEFWSDHFNIWASQDGVSLLKIPDDRDVIRANALTTFGTILRASAHSPAMMEYLNNATNTAASPNENYARELMELHTLSVNGGYTQNDVHEVARCFTGWTYYGAGNGTNSYRFRYNPAVHDTGQKIVLGNVIPARSASAGQQDGDDVLTILINHPSTAQFISKKLLIRFWGYSPSQAAIDTVAAVFTASGGDIRTVLQTILSTVEGSSTPLKLKRPIHLVVSAIRSMQTKVTSHTSFPASLQTPLIQAGHSPFNWQSPDGFPDSLEYWQGGQLSRWNFGADLLNNAYSGILLDTPSLVGAATTPGGVAAQINKMIFAETLAAADLAAITSYLGPSNPSSSKIKEAIGLALASPSFQWY